MIAPDEGVRMLGELMAGHTTAHAAALPLVRSKLRGDLPPFFATIAQPVEPARSAHAADTAFRLETVAPEDRTRQLTTFLSDQVVRVLALGSGFRVDPDRSIMDMGLDSLMAMELRNRLQTALKVPVAVSDLLSGPSVSALGASLQAAVWPEEARTGDGGLGSGGAIRREGHTLESEAREETSL
jgi:hypothetical protein